MSEIRFGDPSSGRKSTKAELDRLNAGAGHPFHAPATDLQPTPRETEAQALPVILPVRTEVSHEEITAKPGAWMFDRPTHEDGVVQLGTIREWLPLTVVQKVRPEDGRAPSWQVINNRPTGSEGFRDFWLERRGKRFSGEEEDSRTKRIRHGNTH